MVGTRARARSNEEGAARHGETPHHVAAVILGKTRRRPAGGMIAALTLALEYDHRGERRHLVGGSRAGDTPADDQNVG